MSAGKMHSDEVATDVALARRLLAAQFPQWARLPIAPVASVGTDNALYRLGEELVVRLPRIASAASDVEDEQRWLQRLAPRLPLPIPAPLALGAPDEGYPWRWSVYRWLPGEDAYHARFADLSAAARELARFIRALQRSETTGWPPPEPLPASRGGPLATRDAETRSAIAAVRDLLDSFDAEAASAAWETALQAPEWADPPVWTHGDLQPLNLLVTEGRLSAVIDWSMVGIGDPACDLMPAWTLFSGASRDAFRATLEVDDASWARGRGWALSVGLIAFPYYQQSNPALAAIALRGVNAVLADASE